MSDERRQLPSASSFASDVACAGRQNMLRAMREQRLSEPVEPGLNEAAERGTRIHAARSSGNTFNLAEDELEAYSKGVKIEQQFVEEWMRDNGIDVLPEPLLEQRMWLHHSIYLNPLLSGQSDVIYAVRRFATVIDWKSSSASYVPAANASWQLRIYALLLWKEYDEAFDVIRVAYVKPETFGAKLDYADLTADDLRHIESYVHHVIWKSQQPDAPLNAGAHCRFCDARGACPEAARFSMLPAIQRGGDIKDTLARIQTMPPEAALEVWRRKGEVNQIIAAITARLTSLPDDEKERLGLSMTAGKKADFILDTVGAFKALRDSGIDEDSILKTMSFSKEPLLKLIQEFTNCAKKQAELIYQTKLDEFIKRERQKPSLTEK